MYFAKLYTVGYGLTCMHPCLKDTLCNYCSGANTSNILCDVVPSFHYVCQFFGTQEYRGIDLSWQQRHLQMTPLFAATLASQTQTQTDGGYVSGPGDGMLRATQQSLAFTPTQGVLACMRGGDSFQQFVYFSTSMLVCLSAGVCIDALAQPHLNRRWLWLQLDGSLPPVSGSLHHGDLHQSRTGWRQPHSRGQWDTGRPRGDPGIFASL